MHLTGDVAEMPRIMEIARKHRLPIIEDGCQSLMGEYNGQRVGTWGDATAFSMHPLKIINVWGDAGIVVTNDDEMNKRVRLLRNHGLRNRDEMEIFGYNSRLDSTQAVVGKWIVRQLPDIVAGRIAAAALLRQGLWRHLRRDECRRGAATPRMSICSTSCSWRIATRCSSTASSAASRRRSTIRSRFTCRMR